MHVVICKGISQINPCLRAISKEDLTSSSVSNKEFLVSELFHVLGGIGVIVAIEIITWIWETHIALSIDTVVVNPTGYGSHSQSAFEDIALIGIFLQDLDTHET